MVAFATFHGLAALINGGLLAADDLDALVAETVERMVLGLRPRSRPSDRTRHGRSDRRASAR